MLLLGGKVELTAIFLAQVVVLFSRRVLYLEALAKSWSRFSMNDVKKLLPKAAVNG